MLTKVVAFSAAVAGATAFAPGASTLPRARAGISSVCMNADPSAPPADLFNIWRQDYMVSPGEAAAQEQERKRNTFFDGVLPPFSNVGNTERGAIPDTPTIRGLGIAADFSSANPTSAYDTATFGKVNLPAPGVLVGETGVSPQDAVQKRVKAGIKNIVRVNPINPYAKENMQGANGRDLIALGKTFTEEGAPEQQGGGRGAAPAARKGTIRFNPFGR